MLGRSERDGKGLRLALILVAFAALIAVFPHRAGLSIAIGGGAISVEMKLAFFSIAFDFEQDRPKMNSLQVALG